MGQKVNPIGLRTALTRNWESRWFADKKDGGRTLFGDWLHEDMEIRAFIKKNYSHAQISKVLIERYVNRVRATIYSARPAALVGKKGAEIETIRTAIGKLLAKGQELLLDVVEIKQPETCA